MSCTQSHSPRSATRIGSGCGGTIGGLDPRGAAVLGEPFEIDLSGAGPGSAVFVFVGTDLLPVDGFAECGLLLQAPTLFLSGTADTGGSASLGADVPADPTLLGRLLHVQGLALGSGGPLLGIGSLTNAIEYLIGS